MSSQPIQSAQYQTVSLASINLQNDGFRITTREDVDELATSIQHDGLIIPPTLIRQHSSENAQFAIVSGFRRVNACRKLGDNDIIARILETDAVPLDCLRLAIAENALQRQLNLIETSRALQKLSSFYDDDVQLARTAGTLGLPANPAILHKLRNLCLLPWSVQHSILSDSVSLSMAVELQKLDPDSAVTFARLFDQLKFSLSKQKEILTLAAEIAQRENSSIPQVMSNPRLHEIIDNEDLDRAQKGRQIRSFLRQWRFPRISQAEKKYQIRHKQLKLGNDIKLIPPKDFEGTTYVLNLNFSNLAELMELRNRLDRLIAHPILKKIVEDRDA